MACRRRGFGHVQRKVPRTRLSSLHLQAGNTANCSQAHSEGGHGHISYLHRYYQSSSSHFYRPARIAALAISTRGVSQQSPDPSPPPRGVSDPLRKVQFRLQTENPSASVSSGLRTSDLDAAWGCRLSDSSDLFHDNSCFWRDDLIASSSLGTSIRIPEGVARIE